MLRLAPAATPSGRTLGAPPTPRARRGPVARAAGEEGGPTDERAVVEARSVFATSPPSGDATLFDAR